MVIFWLGLGGNGDLLVGDGGVDHTSYDIVRVAHKPIDSYTYL
jgi:hypothetical protein